MSGIASIGTATNSNLAGAGPSINITGRTDLTTISMFASNDTDLKNGQHDVKRHEICLSVPQRQIQAYSAVFSFDPFVDMPISLLPTHDYKLLPVPGLNSALDMTISRYYRDVGDARNDLEYILAKNQISLHSMDSNVNKGLCLMQDRLLNKSQNMAQNIFHRRNAIFLTTDAAQFTEEDDQMHEGQWKSATENGYESVYKFTPNTKPAVASLNNSFIYGIVLDIEDDAVNTLYNLTHHLDLAMRLAAQNTEPKVHTAKNVNSAPIEPPDLVYAGIALTDACAHPQNGDTAVTLNIFSALTVDNGPFSVLTNDDLMWIHDIELADFEKDGMRRQRVVLDLPSILRCITPAVPGNENFITHITTRYNRFQAARSTTAITNALKHKPGNPSRKTFLIAPQKKGFGILKRSSVKDKMRHIGTSISSCMPSKRLDLVNGAVAKF